MLSLIAGTVISFAIALVIWYSYGAGAKTDSVRQRGDGAAYAFRPAFRAPLNTPLKPDVTGMSALLMEDSPITAALMVLRIRFTGWILHPVGYAMANTATMNQVWLPFFIAWIVKTFVLRYGGMRLYRQSLPFFYGLIVGDFVAGGLTTAIGCFSGINVYPTNW